MSFLTRTLRKSVSPSLVVSESWVACYNNWTTTSCITVSCITTSCGQMLQSSLSDRSVWEEQWVLPQVLLSLDIVYLHQCEFLLSWNLSWIQWLQTSWYGPLKPSTGYLHYYYSHFFNRIIVFIPHIRGWANCLQLLLLYSLLHGEYNGTHSFNTILFHGFEWRS